MTILGVKITIFKPKWSFRGTNWIKVLNLVILTTKMVESMFEIIFIYTAVKTCTSADTPYGPDYSHLQKSSPHCSTYGHLRGCQSIRNYWQRTHNVLAHALRWDQFSTGNLIFHLVFYQVLFSQTLVQDILGCVLCYCFFFRELVSLVPDLISANGWWLRNQETIHLKTTMISFKMSGLLNFRGIKELKLLSKQIEHSIFKTHNNCKYNVCRIK